MAAKLGKLSFPDKIRSPYYEYTLFDDAWSAVIKPWVAALRGSPLTEKDHFLLVPNSALVWQIKQRLVEEDLATVGLHFATPGMLRNVIKERLGLSQTSALREDLHLIMRAVLDAGEKDPIVEASIKYPDLIVRACDALNEAGHQPEDVFENRHLQRASAEYSKQLEGCGLITAQQMDRTLLEVSQGSAEAILGNVLLCGFSWRNWPHFNLLQAICHLSEEQSLCFFGDESLNRPNQVWQGSWEECAGASHSVESHEFERPYASLAESFEFATLADSIEKSSASPKFLLAQTQAEEADVVVAKALQVLANEEGLRVGIVVANQGSTVGREVAHRLARFNIPHYDHLGHASGSCSEQELFELWCRWQDSAGLKDFLTYFERLFILEKIEGADYLKIKDACTDAFRHLMVQDCKVVFAYIGKNDYSQHLLPEAGTFTDYVERAKPILELMGWPKDSQLLERRVGSLYENFEQPIERRFFVSWLRDVLTNVGRVRERQANEVFARVHLLTVEEAIHQDWTHLILAGLNRSVWPREAKEGGLLSDETINKLNSAHVKQGSQGEGHWVIIPGHALIQETADGYHREEKNFTQLIRSVSKEITLTATEQEATLIDKPLYLSPFYERFYWLSEGELLDETHRKNLLQATHSWGKAFGKRAVEPREFDNITQVSKARHDLEMPFDEFSFSFKTPPNGALNLSAKQWEEIITNPTKAWMRHILGITEGVLLPWESIKNMVTGIWVHDWISADLATKEMRSKPALQDWLQVVDYRAAKVKSIVFKAFEAAKKPVPDWWINNWEESKQKAYALVRSVVVCDGMESLVCEHSLPKDIIVALTEDCSIPIRGRVDLIGTTGSVELSPKKPLWIVDFKTGAQSALTMGKLAKGEGIQLLFYALAFEALGHKDISLSILQPATLLYKQVNVDDLESLKNLFQGIAKISQTGVIGSKKASRRSFGSKETLPLAYLEIEESVLAEKWEITHPNLPVK